MITTSSGLAASRRGNRDPVHVGHVDVEDDNVGIGVFDLGDPRSLRKQPDLRPARLDPADDKAAHYGGASSTTMTRWAVAGAEQVWTGR
jgi:hypothetical protein